MPEKDEPSLELPSFRLRRRRAPTATEATPAGTPVVEQVAQPGPPVVEEEALPGPPVVEEEALPTPRDPRLPAVLAAALTGLVVGLAAIGLVWAGQQACEAMSGTSSCGGGPGLLLLVVVVAALALCGAGLLRVLGVPHPGSTSTLAVGLAAVVTLLLLADTLDDLRGAVFAALTILVAYVVAQAVTSASGS